MSTESFNQISIPMIFDRLRNALLNRLMLHSQSFAVVTFHCRQRSLQYVYVLTDVVQVGGRGMG